jgi:hypothetical protein
MAPSLLILDHIFGGYEAQVRSLETADVHIVPPNGTRMYLRFMIRDMTLHHEGHNPIVCMQHVYQTHTAENEK